MWHWLQRLVGQPSPAAPEAANAAAPSSIAAQQAAANQAASNSAATDAAAQVAPAYQWIEAGANPWHVRLLDVRPLTLGSMSMSRDRQCAINARSFVNDDGTSFIGREPEIARPTKCDLRFQIDALLPDGALFIPREMEHKWAVYYHQRRIICIRSWLRAVEAVAEVELAGDQLVITSVNGVIGRDANEPPEFTLRGLDFLLRSYVLDQPFPAPFPVQYQSDVLKAAMWCMQCWGSKAHFGTCEPVVADRPTEPLRTFSLLHFAAARGNVEHFVSLLDGGLPIDLRGPGGITPLHVATMNDNLPVARLLIERGLSVDARSDEGLTPLIFAIERGEPAAAQFFLDHGADPNARDTRGFTALHRAAEMGQQDFVQLLLRYGAQPDLEAQGHTAKSLATERGHTAIVDML